MNILAAFIFFTRLPFWRIREVPAECFKHVVPYWPLSGWLTGGIMAGVLWLSAQILPFSVAVLLALAARLLITGALHEDGLADFFDGFGGGTNRERILSIMKDSHIGSYGVIGLIFYFLLLWSLLMSLPLSFACITLIAGDTISKLTSSQIINFLPYARKEEESKAKVVYNRMSGGEFAFGLLCGILPSALLLPYRYWMAIVLPLIMLLRSTVSSKRTVFLPGNSYTNVYIVMEVILIRHTSVDVPKGVCYGQTDVPLRDSFEEEASITAQQLQNDVFDAVFTSPLSRCTRLADHCGYPDAIRDARMKELNFGEWEMQEFDKICDPRLEEWYNDYFHVAATGGESFMMQLQRVSEFLNEVSGKEYKRIAVFAHGGVLICAQIYAGILRMEDAFDALTPYGGVVRLQLNSKTEE